MNPVAYTAWRRGMIVIALALAAVALFVAGVNQTQAPKRLADAVAQAVAQRTGWEIEVGGARLTGVGKLRLTEVVLREPGSQHASSLPVVDLSINPLQLIARRGDKPAISSVHLIRPRLVTGELLGERGLKVPPGPGGSRAERGPEDAGEHDAGTMPPLVVTVTDGLVDEVAASGETTRLWRIDGRVELSQGDEGIWPRELRLKQIGGGVEFSLAEQDGDDEVVYQWRARGPSEFFLDLLGIEQWRITGAMEAEGFFAWPEGQVQPGAIRGGQVAAKVTQGVIAWGDAADSESARFDTLDLKVVKDERGWRVDGLTLKKGQALVRAHGELVREAGASSPWELALSVDGTGLVFPQDIPILAKYGLSGRAEFSGALTGALTDPELSGRLTLQEGTVWHRPVSRGEGQLLLTAEGFRFSETVLQRGFSTYVLDGAILWGEAPHRLSIQLDATRGDVRELLRALAVDVDADVEGRVDGTIAIEGPIGALQLAAEARLSEVLVGGVSYFDHAEGQATWADGVLTLRGVTARSGEGKAHVDGWLSDEQLALDVAVERWPLAAGRGPLVSLTGGVDGWASYRGRVVGDPASPMLSGEILGGELQVGRLHLRDPQGEMHLSLDSLELVDVSLVSAGDGRYTLRGTVSGWREASPTLDLDVQVQGASLSGLLLQGGLNLPAWLFDGTVAGSVRVSGEAHAPDAVFDLTLADDLGVADPIKLEFGWQDGRFKLSREMLLNVMMNASRR